MHVPGSRCQPADAVLAIGDGRLDEQSRDQRSRTKKVLPAPAPKKELAAGVEHVVVIVEENQNSSAILGSGDAPYIDKLAVSNVLATNYKGLFHPSLPNYLALTSGTNGGITDDCDAGDGCMAEVPNIANSLDKAGHTWKMYAESMPKPCSSRNTDLYGVRHNPFVYYPGITDDPAYCAEHVVPLTQLAEDLKSTSSLPEYVFISPNVCNDTHDCPVATGDAWFSRQVPEILRFPAFTKQNYLLVLTWEEDENIDNTVATIFAGPAARKGFESPVPTTTIPCCAPWKASGAWNPGRTTTRTPAS